MGLRAAGVRAVDYWGDDVSMMTGALNQRNWSIPPKRNLHQSFLWGVALILGCLMAWSPVAFSRECLYDNEGVEVVSAYGLVWQTGNQPVRIPCLRFANWLRAGGKIVIGTMGTSLTAGVNGWPAVMKEWLDAKWPGQIFLENAAVGGAASSEPKGRTGFDQLSAIYAAKPDIVFIEFAFNDAAYHEQISVAESKNNLIRMIDFLHENNPYVHIALTTMNPCTTRDYCRLTPFYFQGNRDVAGMRSVLLVDFYLEWSKLLQDDRSRFDEFVPDGIHPTLAGYRAIALPTLKYLFE